MKKVLIDLVEKVRIDQRKTFDEVWIDQWKNVLINQGSGSELANVRGPNWLGPNKIVSELTRAELAKVRISHVPLRRHVARGKVDNLKRCFQLDPFL